MAKTIDLTLPYRQNAALTAAFEGEVAELAQLQTWRKERFFTPFINFRINRCIRRLTKLREIGA